MARLNFEETMDRLMRLIQAGYPIIYVVSQEETRVFDCIARIVNRLRAGGADKRLVRWSEGRGLEHISLAEAPKAATKSWLDAPGLPPNWGVERIMGGESASSALTQVEGAQMARTPQLVDSVIVAFDLHPHLGQDITGMAGSMVRPLRHAAERLRRFYDSERGAASGVYQTLVIVAPTDYGRSPELSGDLITIEFPLPETIELQRVVERLVERGELRFPDPIPEADRKEVGDGDYHRRVIELIASAGRGLTLHSYKQGLNMIRVADNTLQPKHIDYMLQLKADTISNRALEYTPHVKIELGGLEIVKQWVGLRRATATSHTIREKYRLPPPKGVMLCGVAGGGKSQMAKLIAKEFNLALLRLDVGALFGSYVGESEQRAREALQMAEVLAPVVLWIDEIDKAFGGAGTNGDNGVSTRVFGHILTWLAEKKQDVFVVATANDHQSILAKFPEFGRKGRFDEIFWVGLPDESAREKIFRIYLDGIFESGLLQPSESEIAAVETGLNIRDAAGDPKERLVRAVAANNVSFRMTGAEIEYAVHEALYRAYDEHQSSRDQQPRLRPQLLVDVINDARKRSLYNGTALGPMQQAEQDALNNRNWVRV